MRQRSLFPPLDADGRNYPPARFLSNGRLTVWVTGEGTGRSIRGEYALTGWRADPIRDDGGVLFYVRDRESGDYGTIGRRPGRSGDDRYRAVREPGAIRIERTRDGIDAGMEVCVLPDGDLEIRRIVLTNRSGRERHVDLTAYAEIVLDRPGAFAAHPAYSKLFVQTSFDEESGALLARRRSRSGSESHPRLFAALAGEGTLEFETDRVRFLGRGRSLSSPAALDQEEPLSGSAGNVLDPVFALRRAAILPPGGEARFLFLLGAADEEAEALAAARSWAAMDQERAARAIAAARERTCAAIERAGLRPERAEYFEALAGAMLYGDPALGAAPEILERARGRIEELSRSGVDPRRPFILLRAGTPEGARLLPEMQAARRYWKESGIEIPLVVLDEDRRPAEADREEDAGILHLEKNDLSDRTANLLEASARLVLDGRWPDLNGEGERTPTVEARTTGGKAPAAAAGEESPSSAGGEDPLLFNGLGGFEKDGSEYVIRLRPGKDRRLRLPPLPWINVIANERFGFLVSERGAGCTWSGNSREHRLTPWSNDPVRDPFGEAFYIRDEETGRLSSLLPGPVEDGAAWEVRHGFGYTTFRSAGGGVERETTLFVPPGDPVKIAWTRLVNRSGEPRRLALFSYRRLVLGALPEEDARFVTTRFDRDRNTLLATNPLAGPFADQTVFAALVPPEGAGPLAFTCDRAAFLGAGGDPARPAALLAGGALGGTCGAGIDPCFAEGFTLELPAGGSAECAFLFGEADGPEEVRALVARHRSAGAVRRAFEETREEWNRLRSGLRVETPVPAIDLMVNGWLPYQTVSCRLHGRTALYQSGGAFGFRDQLQDAAALVYLRPEMTRGQILLHAARQFVEGDVLHWWHPPENGGIRTRFADDRLWLPSITTFYVESTGDEAIWDEEIPYLTAPALKEGEDEVFVRPRDAGETGDLYDHCARAVDLSLALGEHGLPLFGSGDWNDGMNRVGRLGKGESVWMGFFLYDVLGRFLPVVEARGDRERAARYREVRGRIEEAVNDAGWDGDWYRRGYYDDGSPLGSRENGECRIDALAQAWAVLSGAAPEDRADRALDAAEKHLVSERDGLIRLLTPPFADTPKDPGYIKGYLPGVRENGGQYTHGALWLVAALAERGRRGRAAALLEMLSPATRGGSPEAARRYKAEPYAIAADVYGEPPHVGRAGWSWYTGSAAWMYRVAVESILGFRLERGEAIRIHPRIPDDWPRAALRFREPGGETVYEITLENPKGRAERVASAEMDGRPLPVEDGSILVPFAGDDHTHHVRIILG